MQIGEIRRPPAATPVSRPIDIGLPARLKRLSGLSAVYALADMLSKGSAILLVPLYARYMAPGEYGTLALASLAISLLVMLLSFGGQSVVQRYYHQYTDPVERARFLGAFWLFLVAVPGVVLALLWAVGTPIMRLFFSSMPPNPYVELVLGISYLTIAFGTVLPSMFRAREQGGRYLGLSLVTMLVTVCLSVYSVAALRLGAVGALGAQFGGLLVASIISAIVLLRELSTGWRWGQLRLALRYGIPLVPHFAAHWTLSISDRAIVGHFAGLGGVGLYSLAYQFGTVLQMLISSINGAIMPVFSRAARDKTEFAGLPRLATYYFLAVAALGLLVSLTAGDAIVLFTPPEYHSAGAMVPLIALGIMAMGFYFIPMNTLSMTAGKTSRVPALTIIAGAANVGLNLVLVPRFGPVAAAFNTAVGYSLLAILTTAYAQRIVPFNYETRRLVRIAVTALSLFFAGQWLATDNPLVDLIADVILVAGMPAALWLLGFWTQGEKEVVARLLLGLPTPFRTNRPGD